MASTTTTTNTASASGTASGSAPAHDRSHDKVSQSYLASDPSALTSLYDEWAKTYDQEMGLDFQDYVAPAQASACVVKMLASSSSSLSSVDILDAGCGTGLVGLHLAQLGAKHIHGIDLSPGMLEMARKTNVYQSLEITDLSKPIPQKDASYTVVMCIGTFTQGHVGPQALPELVRVTKSTGLVVATVLASIWDAGGFATQVARLAEQAKVKLLSAELIDYRRAAGVQARLVVLSVL